MITVRHWHWGTKMVLDTGRSDEDIWGHQVFLMSLKRIVILNLTGCSRSRDAFQGADLEVMHVRLKSQKIFQPLFDERVDDFESEIVERMITSSIDKTNILSEKELHLIQSAILGQIGSMFIHLLSLSLDPVTILYLVSTLQHHLCHQYIEHLPSCPILRVEQAWWKGNKEGSFWTPWCYDLISSPTAVVPAAAGLTAPSIGFGILVQLSCCSHWIEPCLPFNL